MASKISCWPEALHDGCRTQVESPMRRAISRRSSLQGPLRARRTVGVDVDRQRLCDTDGVKFRLTSTWSATPAATRFWRYAARHSRRTVHLRGDSLPEKAPPPWAPRPP